MSSMQSGGATPEIRQNYSGGHIVFNAIHAWRPPNMIQLVLLKSRHFCFPRLAGAAAAATLQRGGNFYYISLTFLFLDQFCRFQKYAFSHMS